MKTKILSILIAVMAFSSCEDFLTRPPMDTVTDTPEFWNNEDNYRTMIWAFYDIYFDGYKSGWTRSNWFAETNIADWVDDNAQNHQLHSPKSLRHPAEVGISLTYVGTTN